MLELDVATRLGELAELKDGWMDGRGKAPSAEGLRWLSEGFASLFDQDLPLPRLYPPAEGGIQAEWSAGAWESPLEVHFGDKSAEYQAVRMTDSTSEDLVFNLAENDEWKKLNEKLKELFPERA